MNKAYTAVATIVGALIMSLNGCGSASNNDQGVSFTMLGYSVAASSLVPGTPVAACPTTPNLSGGVFAISTSTETAGATNQVLAGVVVQNNLTTQFIRTISLDLQYFIPGASITPPSTTVPYGGVVAKAGGLRCGTVTIVPPAILAWINLNRSSLPELPFSLIARGQVVGSTSAGDVLTSNPVDIGYTVVEDNIIPPVPADPTVPGAGAGEIDPSELGSDPDGVVIGDGTGSDNQI
jgi:hypothetical protein